MNQTDKSILSQTFNPTGIPTGIPITDPGYNLGMVPIDPSGYYGILNGPIDTMDHHHHQNGMSYVPEVFQLSSNWDYPILNDYLFQTQPINPINNSNFDFELYSSTIDLMNDPYHPIPSEGSQPTILMNPITTYLSDEDDQRSDSSTDTTTTTTGSRLHGLPTTRTLPPGLTVPRPKPTLLSSDPGHPLYPCQYCHQPFSRRNSLRRHEQLHSGTKPYQCLPCHRNFSRQDIYKRHRASKRCRKLTSGQGITTVPH